MKILAMILCLSMTLEPSETIDLVKIAEKTGKTLSSVNTALQAVKDGLHNVKVLNILLSFPGLKINRSLI